MTDDDFMYKVEQKCTNRKPGWAPFNGDDENVFFFIEENVEIYAYYDFKNNLHASINPIGSSDIDFRILVDEEKVDAGVADNTLPRTLLLLKMQKSLNKLLK